ncbi:hypothetical protein [Ruegeria sp. EL01]|uniref:hypothetical protein n=1 Tax=Ruegeria sp. EL01 TaxID=2107578 RepID=UPI000EA80C8F|nr:hypothetical protein [Ruegeria sp. EL01]
MNTESIGLYNTGLPVLIVAVAAVLLPSLLWPRETRSHYVVFVGVLASTAFLLCISATVLFFFDHRDVGAWADLVGYWPPLRYYFRNGLMLGLVWIPLLAIIWLSKAQKIERLKGLDLVRGIEK